MKLGLPVLSSNAGSIPPSRRTRPLSDCENVLSERGRICLDAGPIAGHTDARIIPFPVRPS